jgi:hypothetical protein
MMKNIIFPFRYTLFSYFTIKNKPKLIEEALKFPNLRLVRDIEGMHPLNYLIRSRNFETSSLLINLMSEN